MKGKRTHRGIATALLPVLLLLMPYLLLRLFFPIRYQAFVEENAAKYGIPPEIVFAVIHTESHFRKDALSSAGAKGLMQLMPQTYSTLAKELGRRPEKSLLSDPETNIACGVYLLHLLYQKYGCWETVFAAYNAGEPTVDRWLKDPSLSSDGVLRSIPYPETAAYVKKVTRAIQCYQFLYHKSS